jgi:hypothetical protein
MARNSAQTAVPPPRGTRAGATSRGTGCAAATVTATASCPPVQHFNLQLHCCDDVDLPGLELWLSRLGAAQRGVVGTPWRPFSVTGTSPKRACRGQHSSDPDAAPRTLPGHLTTAGARSRRGTPFRPMSRVGLDFEPSNHSKPRRHQQPARAASPLRAFDPNVTAILAVNASRACSVLCSA